MDAMQLLLERNSHPKLGAPAPAADTLRTLYQAALRAPDHNSLRPWRFIQCTGPGLERLGEVFVAAQQAKDADSDDATLDKMRKMPLRAPMVVVIVASPKEDPKVPEIEQQLSAGCAAHALLMAAQAKGFAGIWRTGWLAFDEHVHHALGLNDSESIVGFLYLGTPAGRMKPLPELDPDDFVSEWS
ncbi:nitroreductase [Terasakiispira papahanaumokuakeensis]|uniref:Putative NAD(P)H nitroreductase n=1 Tax=Terasakiispira papahanaumokuakeensis TaxID=197479 RepID=A0A1E2VAA1_9GAMM|nr:NAD(P)H nitroreductase [Terasakiispira papahanaumokuakeensis]ODC03904.1 nitroreductase [Terasakiispira papahanaumokuakeensis]